jgi:hypothetical protein
VEPTPTPDIPRQVRELLALCHDAPATFQTAILGRQLWAKQVELCQVIARAPITVVPAGRVVGESFLLAGLVLWWLYTRPLSLVLTTGPDHRQVVSVLWKEIRRALRPRRVAGKRLPRIPLRYHHLTRGYCSPQRLELEEGTAWGALGFAAKSTEGFSGQHAGELLVLIDEASGIADEIWTAIESLGARKLVIAGNPLRYDCHFRELHDLAVAGSTTIQSLTISALDSPHAQLDHSPVGLASRSFLQQVREIHGEETPFWNANILGQFPGQDSVQFLPRAWLDACTQPGLREDPLWQESPAGEAWMGVDVGGGVGADQSVVLIRDRKQLRAVFASPWHGVLDDARHRLEPVVVDLARQHAVAGSRVIYDQSGLGRSFGSYLRQHGLEGAIGYFGASRGGRLYVNRRTANAFALKRRLDPHRQGYVPFDCSGLPQWPALREELAALHAPTMAMEEGQVKQVLEAKEKLRGRLGRSPDLLDALLMTFTYSDG